MGPRRGEIAKIFLVISTFPSSRLMKSSYPLIKMHLGLVILLWQAMYLFEPVREKTNNLGYDQVRHKSGCTVTEDG